MKAIYPPDLIPFLKNKHLLLDTNVFRDASTRPSVYGEFFNHLKENAVSLVTIDIVKYELLKGSADMKKYQDREKLITQVTDIILPITGTIYSNIFGLIKLYGIDGSALDITDFILGAFLIQYSSNLCLMTRDTTDFRQNIFKLTHVVNIPYTKGIFTYGIYQYNK